MKGTEPLVVASRLLEWYVRLYHFDDIQAILDFVDNAHIDYDPYVGPRQPGTECGAKPTVSRKQFPVCVASIVLRRDILRLRLHCTTKHASSQRADESKIALASG